MMDVVEKGKFRCRQCGEMLNRPKEIPQTPSPAILDDDKMKLNEILITCPKCGKRYIYNKKNDRLRVSE